MSRIYGDGFNYKDFIDDDGKYRELSFDYFYGYLKLKKTMPNDDLCAMGVSYMMFRYPHDFQYLHIPNAD